MLIYEKRAYVDNKLKITLYGTLGSAPAESDLPIVFADPSGTELSERPTLSASYVSNLVSGGYDILRTDDGQEMIVGIKTGSNITWVIGKVSTDSNEDENIDPLSDDDDFSNDSVVKGDLITMNLGNGSKQYRVLSVENNMANVVGMDSIAASAFEVLSDSNVYDSSDLDELLTKWHVELSDEARAAIQIDYIYQYEYPFDKSAYDANTHASYADVLEQTKKSERLARYIYALDVDDIEDYFGGKYSTDDLKMLFWNDTADHDVDTSFLLRSAEQTSSVAMFYVGGHGMILEGPIGTSFAVRPAFKIDLTKIAYTK